MPVEPHPLQEVPQSLMNGTQAARGGGSPTSFEIRNEASECEMEPKLVAS